MASKVYNSDGELKYGKAYSGSVYPPILNIRKVGRHYSAAHPRFIRQCEKRTHFFQGT